MDLLGHSRNKASIRRAQLSALTTGQLQPTRSREAILQHELAVWLYSTCLVAQTPPSAGASLRHLCKQSAIPEVDDPLLGSRLHPKGLYQSLFSVEFNQQRSIFCAELNLEVSHLRIRWLFHETVSEGGRCRWSKSVLLRSSVFSLRGSSDLDVSASLSEMIRDQHPQTERLFLKLEI